MNKMSSCLHSGVDALYTRARPLPTPQAYPIPKNSAFSCRHVDNGGVMYTIVLPYTCIIAMSTVVKKRCRQITWKCRHDD